ncbi:hypothetical protein EXE59_04960 [Nocardioides eburneiflavus]|uniref:Uncharacterized protein n=1 Tax=Nocardioides eburneiflavus TaxID=2518372 RepID=A0A4Z1CF08_9ACTN|nr:hypothetical protein EXE59_04960 [Nocardioides eburneiflavus]
MTPARFEPPLVPVTAVAEEFERQWLSLADKQLESVRKMAENWRTGLAALLGLVSIFSVVKAPTATADMDTWAIWTTGGLLFTSALLAVLGADQAMRAAYGVPQRMVRAKFFQIGGTQGINLAQAEDARSALRVARIMTYVALAALAGSVAMTWWGPGSDSDQVRATTSQGLVVCGTLVESADGVIQVDSKTAGPQRVKLTQVVKLEAVSTCDE